MDRRGQVDKAITALPVFFAVAVVLILFTLLSSGVFGFKKFSEHDAAFSSVHMPVLLETVTVNGSEMTVLHAFRNAAEDEEKIEELLQNLSSLTPRNGCLIFAYSTPVAGAPETIPHGIHISMIDGTTKITDYSMDQGISFFRAYEPYLEANALQKVTLRFADEQKAFTFITYKGRCING